MNCIQIAASIRYLIVFRNDDIEDKVWEVVYIRLFLKSFHMKKYKTSAGYVIC